jgi:serine/threonine protein kinase
MLDILDRRYKVIKPLGTGNSSKVFLVENMRLGNKFAIKVVPKDNKINDLLKEAELLTQLNYQGLPKVIDVFEEDGNTFLVEEFIDGNSLEELVITNGCMNWKTVVELMIKLCDTLTYLHELEPNPLIHKDIKPSNIMLDSSGRIVLLDFGITKIVEINNLQNETCIIGTPFYAAPEQCDGRGATIQSDLFSLGITMIYLLKGVVPDGFKLHRKLSIKETGIPEGLIGLINRCTDWNMDKRPANAREVKKILVDIVNPSGFFKTFKNSFNIDKKNIPMDYRKTVVLTGLNSSGVTTIAVALSECFMSSGVKSSIIELRKNKKLACAFGNIERNRFTTSDDIVAEEKEYYNFSSYKNLLISPDRYRDIYISRSEIIDDGRNFQRLLSDCKLKSGVTILCSDFEYVDKLAEFSDCLYVVKDTDLNSLEEYSELFSDLLQQANIKSKISIVFNKYLNGRINQSDIAAAMSPDKIPFSTIYFELENLRQATGCFAKSFYSCKSFTPTFKNSIESIAKGIYPI